MTATLSLSDRAREIVKASDPDSIPDYVYFGDLPLGTSYGSVIMVHRDSGTLDRSNFTVIYRDLQLRFPDDVEIQHDSHFAVGWIDKLQCRYLTDTGDITDAGIAALEWIDKLADYPVANEDHYADLEYNEALGYIHSELRWMEAEDIDAGDVIRWLGDNGNDYAAEYIRYDDLVEAVEALKQ